MRLFAKVVNIYQTNLHHRCLASRISHQKCFMKKGVVWNCAKLTGKHLYERLFFNEVADLRPATLLKKRLWHMRFPVSFAKCIRPPFLQNISGRLFLYKVLKTSSFSAIQKKLISTKHVIRRNIYFAGNNDSVGIIFE